MISQEIRIVGMAFDWLIGDSCEAKHDITPVFDAIRVKY